MTERHVKYILAAEPYFPTLHLKVDKGNSSFLYCITLYILRDYNLVELCHCDNYHEKGSHIHIPNGDGSFKQIPYEFKSIGETIEYFKNNWERYLSWPIK